MANPNWVKEGPSPNPGGRPKEEAELKRIIDEKCPPEFFVNKLLEFMNSARNHSVKLAALVHLLDRRYGKVRQSIDIKATVDINALFDEMIQRRAEFKKLA